MERLDQLLSKLKLYPDLQKEIISVVHEHAKQSSEIVLKHTPIRLGFKRLAKEEVQQYLSSLENHAIFKMI